MARKSASKFSRKMQNRFLGQVLKAETLSDAIIIIRTLAMTFAPTGHTGWHEALLMLASGLESGVPRFKVITRKGNRKLPFAAFSTLAVFTCAGAGACIAWCYSLKAWQYPGAFARQLQNTLLLKFDRSKIADDFAKLPADCTFRLYVDGDFSSVEDARFWFDVVRSRPDVRVYGYSKSWDVLMDCGSMPDNYFMNVSSGGKIQRTTKAELLAQPRVRGEFVAVPIDYHGVKGFKRYQDPEYHRAVRAAAIAQGIEKPFSCPGACGTCTNKGPACGIEEFRGKVICIGIH